VLDSGKVDENRFLSASGIFSGCRLCRLIRRRSIGRRCRFCRAFRFSHHILPIEVKENSVVLGLTIFSIRSAASWHRSFEKTREWVLVPRSGAARHENALRRRRGNVR